MKIEGTNDITINLADPKNLVYSVGARMTSSGIILGYVRGFEPLELTREMANGPETGPNYFAVLLQDRVNPDDTVDIEFRHPRLNSNWRLYMIDEGELLRFLWVEHGDSLMQIGWDAEFTREATWMESAPA